MGYFRRRGKEGLCDSVALSGLTVRSFGFRTGFTAAWLAMFAMSTVHSAEIEGTVTVMHRLTKKKVTAPASAYQRGVAVEIHSDSAADVLAMERSRVVVYLEGERASRPVTVKMEQKDRQFIPDTVVIPAGSTVSFPNLDPVFHNVFSLSRPKEFDLGNYPKDHTRTVTFSKPGIVFVDCHLHPNMAGVIVVSPNGWSTKADQDGHFLLSDIPPGTYTLVAWHKAAGFFRQEVRVANDGNAQVTFVIPLDENGNLIPIARR